MGCLDSKMDAKRKALADDWTGGEYAYAVGGIVTLDAFCPLDKIAVKFCGGEAKELKDGIGELTETKLAEDKAKELGDKIFTALKKLHEDFKADKDSDKKVFGKYTAKAAFEDIDNAVKKWCEKSGLEHSLEEKPADAPEGMEMAMADGDMAMEGGDEAAADGMMAMGDGAAAARSTPGFDSFGEISGKEQIPLLLLAMYAAYPAFGDAVKAQVLDYEFGGSGSDDLAAVATIIGGFVDASEKAEGESWGCAWLTGDEVEELKALDTKVSALVFPGTCVAWADKDTAIGSAGEKPDGKTKCVFQFAGHHMAKDKAHIFHRQFAKVKEVKEEGGDLLVTLEDFTEAACKTVAEWSEKVKKAAEGAGAAVEAAKDAADMAMGDGDKMDDPPADM